MEALQHDTFTNWTALQEVQLELLRGLALGDAISQSEPLSFKQKLEQEIRDWCGGIIEKY